MAGAILLFLLIAIVGICASLYGLRDALSMYWRRKPPE
jgi:hypothetical protein